MQFADIINDTHTRNKRVFGRELTNLPEYADTNKNSKMEVQPYVLNCIPMVTDKITQQDPVDEYSNEIYNTLKENETKHIVHPNFMRNQVDINDKMRAILIDWLIEVHLKFKLLPETLYLTVSLIDRYIEKKQILRQKLQLVGVTSMLIACKYEEIYSPEVKDFVYITDKAYTREEILSMELDMLQTLEYNVTMPSSWRFLQYYSKLINYDQGVEFSLSQYILELSMLEVKLAKNAPSMLALGALYLTMKIMKKPVKWPSMIQNTELEIRACAKELCCQFQNAEKGTLQSLKKKFSASKYHEVSKIKLECS